MPLASGTRLGPYEVIDPLGKGAMGEVYRARDTRLGREVAIKVLPEHTANSPDALARFEFEARAVGALNHPNILALHDVGTAGSISYAVMELLDGETLRDRLRRDGRLPPRKVVDLAVEFARGLAAAHARGIIHRDLKPENLFLTRDGRLKILDFGIAVHEHSSAAASAAETRMATDGGVLVGTVGYMAPEQVRGVAASARSDTFAFGLVLYEALTGTNPFARATAAETIAAILRDDPPSLAGLTGLPAAAARIVDRCLEKRAEDRPESLRDVAEFLDATKGAAPRDDPGADRLADDIRHFARRGLVLACALLALAVAASWAYVRARANRAVGAAIEADATRAGNVVNRAQQDRLARLRLSARLVASFPELKALFETNAPTIVDFLTSYQRRNETPLLIALGAEGYVLARGDHAPGVATERGEGWLQRLRAAGDAGVITLDGRAYHAGLASAEAGGTIFGSIVAAAPVDNTFAQTLREATQDEVILFDGRGVTGTSLRTGQVPWDSLQAFRDATGGSGTRRPFTIDGVRYSPAEIVLSNDPLVTAVILASGGEIAGAYRGIEWGILLIGTAALMVLAVAGMAAVRQIR